MPSQGDPVAIAEYLGGDDAFHRAITDFSERYADQNQQDFVGVRQGGPTGRIVAQEGV